LTNAKNPVPQAVTELGVDPRGMTKPVAAEEDLTATTQYSLDHWLQKVDGHETGCSSFSPSAAGKVRKAGIDIGPYGTITRRQ
jgi:hypothetical protein